MAGCAGLAGIDRTWKATDACGNLATCVQHLTFIDTTPPAISCPANRQLNCGDLIDPAHTGSATATDNCAGIVTISFIDAATPADCAGLAGIDRTWKATDACGNLATCVQHLSFVDTTPPAITCPADQQLNCGDPTDPAHTGSATATDNCGGPVTITFTDAITAIACAGVPGIDRTWKATDACGNLATCVQHLSFVDTTPPAITCPADQQLNCGAPTDPVDTGSATATDNCAGIVTITFTDAATPAGCAGLPGIDRTWKATDACGNLATCVQHLSFVDTTPPAITCPANQQLNCGAPTDPAHTGSATATDNCAGIVTITFTDAATPAGCAGRPGLDRTWKATDACGNLATCVQHLSFVDTMPPAITCPTDRQLNCGDPTDPAHTGSATATDNCGGTVAVSFTDTATPAGCAGLPGIDRSWKATDACGNVAACVQHITVVDGTLPILACPADKQLNCGDPTDPAHTGTATATDNCGGVVTISFTDTATPPGCLGVPGIARTWTATDACGKVAGSVQHIRFVDSTLPSIASCPPDTTIDCGGTPQFGDPTFQDDCDQNLTVTHTDSVATDNLGQSIYTRTWTATDDCGNSATCHQSITVGLCGGSGTVCAVKFYDANTDGLQSFGELGIAGWKVILAGGPNNLTLVGWTGADGSYCFDNLPAGTYTISEAMPLNYHWSNVTPKSFVVLVGSGPVTKKFGNICLGAGGGDGTPGFWGNKNGENIIKDPPNGATPELTMLSDLCLRTATGANFDPKNYADFKTWLQQATANNMAYMLSIHLACLELSVESGRISSTALIYAPNTTSANAQGFATVNAVMLEANALLSKNGFIPSSSPDRPYASALKDALSNANNNLNFVQPGPCPHTF